jgi:hypothetical protein
MPGARSKYLMRPPWKLSQNKVKVSEVWLVIVKLVDVFELSEWLDDSDLHDASGTGNLATGLACGGGDDDGPHRFEQLARTSTPQTRNSRRFISGRDYLTE